MANKGREVKVGAVTYKSLTKAYEAAKKMHARKGEVISYMTFYMRIRSGMTPAQAMARSVRKYNKKPQETFQNPDLRLNEVQAGIEAELAFASSAA